MLKYEMIVNDLQKRIMNEEFEETRKLPTEEKLIEEYGVSRNTIRNAIKILMNLGIIYPVQGSGMFVRAPKKKGTVYLNSTRGVTMDNPGNKIINKLLDIQIVEADEKLSEQMNCKVGTPVYYLKRLRWKHPRLRCVLEPHGLNLRIIRILWWNCFIRRGILHRRKYR